MTDASQPEYLFVYGTLRRDAGHPMASVLHAASSHVGQAHFRGRLYRVSWYPCAVPSDSPEDRVIGDVFALHAESVSGLLEQLDEYEGVRTEGGRPPYYRRERHPVSLVTGEVVESWIYLFNRPVDALERIGSGDFLFP